MGLFGKSRKEKEREEQQRHREAQQRLEDSRRRQQDRATAGMGGGMSPGASGHMTSGMQMPGGIPVGAASPRRAGGGAGQGYDSSTVRHAPPTGGGMGQQARTAGMSGGAPQTGTTPSRPQPSVGTNIPVSSGSVAGGQFDTYVVQAGDTLSAIARRFYGSASSWQGIFDANRTLLKDPDRIYPGQVLRVPRKGQGKPLA